MKRNAVAWVAIVMSAAALLGSRNLTRPLPAAQEIPAEGQKHAKELSLAFEAVADFVKPSVVQISIERRSGALRRLAPGRRGLPQPGPNGPQGNMDPKDLEELLKRFRRFLPDSEDFDFENQQFTVEGTGSGFVYDDRGHILTNNHVVEGAGKITVTFHDGETAQATVVGTDPESDVAVIKVDRTDYRPVLRGRSKELRVGEWVLAFGSPFGLDQTVTAGIVSATNRNDVHINAYEAFIQTDAAINPGNSGGPLVNMDGRVVGVNSAIATNTRSSAGVGFAIPIDMASQLADSLIKNGKVQRARLGILLQPLTPALAKTLGLDAKTKGVLVEQIVPGSPAEKAGLKPGDVLTRFAGSSVENVPSFRLSVATSDVGKPFDLTYLREGKERTAQVVLAPAEQVEIPTAAAERPRSRPRAEAPTANLDEYGLTVQELTPALAAQFGYGRAAKGLVVTAVEDSGPAADAGLEVGDLINQVIRDQKVQTVTGLKEFQALASQGDELAIHVQTADNPGRFVTLSKVKKG
ncbi:MAG TPA: trypsin-like peptidase domain-containing protein [Isosphaeraceae bacterium]